MIEITENLHRAELTALERSKLVAEWAELTGESVATCDSKGGRAKREGVRDAARQLGMDKDDVHRAVRVASLSPEAQAVAVEEGLGCERSGTGAPPFLPGRLE